MNERTISPDYRNTYARIREIREKEIPIQIETSFDIPHLVLANRRNTRNVSATHLSKLSIMIAEAFKITSVQHPAIPTIYLYGPQLIGDTQAVNNSQYLTPLGRDWGTYNSDTLGSEKISISSEGRDRFTQDISELNYIAEISLPRDDMIRMSYDLLFNRDPPTGSIRIEGFEAFSEPIINTLCRNFIKAEQLGIIKKSKKFGEINWKGVVEISECFNELDACKGLDRDCLKIGPSNNLLTYHAIYFLNRLGGYKANLESIASLLASHYLFEKSRIEKLIIDMWRSRKRYSESRNLYEMGKTDGLSKNEIYEIENIKTYDEKFVLLKPDVLDNVKRSLRTLEKERNVVKKESGHYIVLGNAVKTADGYYELPDRSIYAKTISRIREFNKWMSKAG